MYNIEGIYFVEKRFTMELNETIERSSICQVAVKFEDTGKGIPKHPK